MSRFVVLLRGVNVGGRNSLPMREFSSSLESLGAFEVKTYIQSGNAVFDHRSKLPKRFAADLRGSILERKGFEPHVMILPFSEFVEAMETNPFPEWETEPKALHLGFLDGDAKNADISRLESLAAGNEQFRLQESRFYLAAPDGIGKSKLAAGAEKCLGVPMTMRNWRTVCKIRDMGGGTGE